MDKIILFTLILILSGCSNLLKPLGFGQTYAEKQAGYSYVPVEPSTVKIECPDKNHAFSEKNCTNISKASLLNSLPDNSVRIATRQVSGSVTSGIPAIGGAIGVQGNTYEVIIDFVNTQTVNKQFIGKWFVTVPPTVKKVVQCYPYEASVLDVTPLNQFESWSLRAKLLGENEYDSDENYDGAVDRYIAREKEYEQIVDVRCPVTENGPTYTKENYYTAGAQATPQRFNIPVYYGIGLRLKAKVTVLKGEVNLSSLPALTVAVEAGTATGTMSVQTIGISGKAARTNLLLLDKIDATTIQNAIQVLASIKSSIESGDTTISPRIVGFHNTIGAGAQGINLIHSLLSSDSNGTLKIDPRTHATENVDKPSNTFD